MDHNVERARTPLMSDHHQLMLKMNNPNNSELNLNWFIVNWIYTQDSDMRKMCTKMVSKNLTTVEKISQRYACQIFREFPALCHNSKNKN